MRFYEKLNLVLCFAHFTVLMPDKNDEGYQKAAHVMICINLASIIFGSMLEGLRLHQIPVNVFYFMNLSNYYLEYSSVNFEGFWYFGAFMSFYLWFWFSEGDTSRLTPTGRWEVGYREVKTKVYGNDCAVYYPI